MDLRSRVFPGVLWGTFSSVGSGILQLIQLAILGRLLRAEEFGLVAMATVVTGLATVYADFGMNNAILTHRDITNRQLSSLYWLNWTASIGVGLIIVLAAPLVASGFGEEALVPLIYWSVVALLFTPLGSQYQLLLQKELRIKPIAIAEMIAATLGLIVATVWALRGAGALAIVFGAVTTAATKSLLMFIVGVRRWPIAFHFSGKDVRPYLSFGAYQLGERTLNFATRNVDKVLIGMLLGAFSLGLYHVAYQVMQKPLQLVQPIVTRVAVPFFASISEDSQSVRSNYLLITQAAAIVLFPIFLLITVIAEPVLLLLVGSKWSDATPVLRWLSIWGCFSAIGFVLGSLLLAYRRADIAFWYNVWGVVVYASAISIGSNFGIEGVAIALVAVQLLALFPVGFWLRWKVMGMGPKEYILAFLPVLVIGGLSALATGFIRNYSDSQGWIGSTLVEVTLSSVTMCAVYLALTGLFLRGSIIGMVRLYRQRTS
jgi:O-antigen/teichoic acid export membrane protein